ncbi:MAG: helix-turn-helix transcriptional regulator [Sphingomonadales bacterium]|nr:helix-turn-helix transcriptional regulator [Sphingomonadales bacterium]
MKNSETSHAFGRHGRRHGHHGEGRGGGGGRRRRLFDGEGLRLMALHLIGEEPRHGYDLIRALSDRSGGAWAPSPGMVYPLLALLTEMGLIAEDGQEGSRKRFALTEAGVAERDKAADETQRLLARLDGLASEAARVDPAPVRRAVHNLRAVLIERMGREDATPETVFEAAALIDATAQAIERL